jgi:hypothetical protein
MSGKKGKKSGTKSVPTSCTPFQHKTEWNNYLTENEYRLSPEDILKRKNLLISKYNMFQLGPKSTAAGTIAYATNVRTHGATPDNATASSRKKKSTSGHKSVGDECGYDYMLHRPNDELADLTVLDILEDADRSVDSYTSIDGCQDERVAKSGKLRGTPSSSRSRPHGDDYDFETYRVRTEKFAKGAVAAVRPDPAIRQRLPSTANTTPRVSAPIKKHHSSGSFHSTARPPAVVPTATTEPEPSMVSHINMLREKSQLSQRKQASADNITEIMAQLRLLLAEMKDYEFLTNKPNQFDSTILDELISDHELQGSTNPEEFKTQLISGMLEMLSQSLTYLLQSEVESKKQRSEIESLSEKVENYLSLLLFINACLNFCGIAFARSQRPAYRLGSHQLNQRCI